MTLDPQTVDRFADELGTLVDPDERLGLAVSGGPDSLALLLLAAEARPGMVEAATVDHGLRPESAREASTVARQCDVLGVPHRILSVEWDQPPTANVQAKAREARYRLLRFWAGERQLAAVATAHHADDQAETLLMRLARGAGLSGLVGIRSELVRGDGLRLVRPLLSWRKDELVALCEREGFAAADDPSNRNLHHDRVRIRQWLSGTDFDPTRLLASANALKDADDALEWALLPLTRERLIEDGQAIALEPEGLPRELLRRLLLIAFERLGAPEPRGPDLLRAIAALEASRKANLSGLLLTPGSRWRIEPEPPRRA